MNIQTNRSGFTLLEIIIVIIIVGVLASLALPRFFATVEYAKSTEALGSISALRQSLERCYLQRGGTYVGCTLATLDMNDPGTSPNAHFGYGISGASVTGYVITATRNTLEGGTATDVIRLTQTATGVTRSGTGSFAGLQ